MPYIGKAPSSGIRSRFIYTATASQTTFTGADGNGKTLGYTDGEYVDVYLNGVLLDPADYTATSKTSVVLDSGATVSDIVEIVVYDTFSVFNGTFTGDLTVDGDTLFVDSTNNKVGVGETTGLLGKLHVKTADSSGSADSGADELVIENSGDTGLTILSGTTNSGSIRFGDSDDSDNGIIIYNHDASPYMRFFVDAAERLRIDSSGNVGIGTTSPVRQLHVNAGSENVYLHLTNAATGTTTTDGLSILVKNSNSEANIIQREAAALTFSTSGTERARILSGGGLTFNGDTSTDNALDDYEIGSWTPTYSISGGSFNMSLQLGTYVKVGEIVTATARVRGQRVGGSGTLTVTGLPYSTRNIANVHAAISIGYTNGWATSPQAGFTATNGTTISFKKNGSSSANSNLVDDITQADVNTSSTSNNDIIFSVTYVAN